MDKQLKEIEIPFGAKDSELCGWEYTIPEGMEATIVDNKIVVKKKESEDEKIRKALLSEFIHLQSKGYKFAGLEGEQILAWLEKQDKQKSLDDIAKEVIKDKDTAISFLKSCGIMNENGELADEYKIDEDIVEAIKDTSILDKVEPKFKVKYAGSEYNVLEVKDIAGVTFYGIEDEPNHIDYVKAENCEIISGYVIKENGSPYPTKPAVFSEQNPAWSEDEFAHIVGYLVQDVIANEHMPEKEKQPTKFFVEKYYNKLRPQSQWNPSEEQLRELHCVISGCSFETPILVELEEQLKKL